MRYVVAVADEGGFGRAARVLGVAQPSVSQAIAQLEHELGVRLFDRVGRQVRLTAAGAAMMAPGRRMLREARIAIESVASVRGLEAGHVDVVALPTVAADPLAGLIGAFRRAYPRVLVRVSEPETADEALSMVASGLAELAVAEVPVDDDELVADAVFTQELVVVAPPGVDVGIDGVSGSDLARWPLIAPPPGTSTRRLVDAALAASGHKATVAVETAQRESIVPLVLAGAGVAVLPEQTARRAAEDGARVSRFRPPLIRTLGFVHRRGSLSPAATALVRLATESLVACRDTAAVHPDATP